jgi:cellulose synthase operon protein C
MAKTKAGKCMTPFKLQSALALALLSPGAASLWFLAQPAGAQTSAVQQLEARARALDAQGRHDLAADNWRQVLLIDPKQPDALAALASYYQSIGDTTHAQQYLQQMRSAGASAPVAAPKGGASGGDPRLQQAAQLAAGHHYKEALALYRQVFGASPPAGSWAVAYYETEAAIPEELPSAVAGLRALIAKYPQDPTYQLSLGRVLTYRPATRLEGARMLAELRGSAAQMEQARADWRQAILWDPTGPAATQTAAQYLRRYPDSELEARLKSAEARPAKPEPPVESPLEGEGYKALAAGDLDVAREKFSSLLGLPGSAGKAHAGLGYVAMQEQDFPAAVDNFQQARLHGLQTPAIDKALLESRYFEALSEGNKALKAKDFDAAAADFGHARQIDPQRPEAIEALAGAQLAAGQPGKAEGLFAVVVKSNPDNLDAWVEWLDALLAAGEAQQVLDEQTKIPAGINRRLEQRVDYLAILSSANKALGDDAAAQRLIDRIEDAASRGGAQSAAAQLRAAGLLMQQGNTDGAAQLCRSIVQTDHGDVEAWEILVRAAHVSGDDISAISVAERMPEAVYKSALKDPEFLMTLAAIDQSREQYDQAAKLLERARSMGSEDLANSPRLQLQLASLDLASGNPEHAYNTYRKVASEYPDQLQAWSGMLAALHAGKHDQEALLSVQRIPPEVSLRLRADAAFLQVLASIYSESGHPRQALECLRAVSALYQQRNQAVPFAVDTQFAWLLLNEGDQRQLAAALDRLGNHRGLTAAQKLELENIWAAWSMRRAEADYTAGNAHKALAILQIANEAYPDNTALRRELCSMYVRTGNPGPALKIYEEMNWETAKVGDYASAVDAALVAHRMPTADKWLQEGLQRYPGNDQLLALGARLEEQRGDVKRAKQYLLAEIDNSRPTADGGSGPGAAPLSGLPSIEDDDAPSAAVPPGKALAEMLGATSGSPLHSPSNSKSTPAKATAAPSLDSRSGVVTPNPAATLPDRPANERFDPLPPNPTVQRSLRDENFVSPSQRMRSATYSSSDLPAWPAEMSFPQAPPQASPKNQDYAASQLSEASARLVTTPLPDERPRPQVSLREVAFNGAANDGLVGGAEVGGPQQSPDPTSGDPVRSFTSSTPVPVSEASAASEQQASDQLAALESRYSPYVGGGGYIDSHTGTQGFDRLQRFQASTEASSVIGDSVRLTVISGPILLEAGIPDGNSNYRFGSETISRSDIVVAPGSTVLPTADQFASGFGGELQVASKFVQGSIGYSPANFPVPHVLGSLAVQPGSLPLTFLAYRQNVTDTLLSYAGLEDPYSGKVWGGVVATGGTVKFSHGTGLSGFYASLDGQELTGRNVANNSRIDGGTGAYFQVYASKYGVLKVGANLTAMHYANNQRYFTFGQGGYFSPNQFLLMNAPITWQGTPFHNFSYVINGSLGVQTFQDDPAMPGSLIIGNGAQSVTGASYDFHARVAYHLNQHWLIEGFLDANNARDYANAAGGFSIRYLVRPVPTEGGPTGIVDEKQIRPVAIP